jgi:hypothetical protein
MNSEKHIQESVAAVSARFADRLAPTTQRAALPALLDALGQEWDCLATKNNTPEPGFTTLLFRYVPENDFFLLTVSTADWAVRQHIVRVF